MQNVSEWTRWFNGCHFQGFSLSFSSSVLSVGSFTEEKMMRWNSKPVFFRLALGSDGVSSPRCGRWLLARRPSHLLRRWSVGSWLRWRSLLLLWRCWFTTGYLRVLFDLRLHVLLDSIEPDLIRRLFFVIVGCSIEVVWNEETLVWILDRLVALLGVDCRSGLIGFSMLELKRYNWWFCGSSIANSLLVSVVLFPVYSGQGRPGPNPMKHLSWSPKIFENFYM